MYIKVFNTFVVKFYTMGSFTHNEKVFWTKKADSNIVKN